MDKVRKEFGKTLDRRFPSRPLPTDHDAMADHPDLINRAVAMHLLREGQFAVASTFVQEAQQVQHNHSSEEENEERISHRNNNHDEDADMEDEDTDDEYHDVPAASEQIDDMIALQSHQLQEKFEVMYSILGQLKQQNLLPAIAWATANRGALEELGSNLEFELCKRQYIWLFKGASSNNLPDDADNGLPGALRYGRANFPRFSAKYSREIAQLSSAMAFQPNIPDSPYASMFGSGPEAFDEVANNFTREFCSLLGLSAESPLYVAVTAGAVALPRLMKYMEMAKERRTEWTTSHELAFEIPLPKSMIYHSIFVCPVSKEQTTDANPPIMLPCGHVLAKESMQNLVRHGQRIKCPYCPQESLVTHARQIYL